MRTRIGGNCKLYLTGEPVRQHDEELELEFAGMPRVSGAAAGALA